ARRHLVTLADDAGYLGAHLLDRDVEGVEDACGQALLLTEKAEQDVLGPDVVVLESPSLVLGQDDHLAGPFSESFEHTTRCPLSLGRRGKSQGSSSLRLHWLRRGDDVGRLAVEAQNLPKAAAGRVARYQRDPSRLRARNPVAHPWAGVPPLHL